MNVVARTTLISLACALFVSALVVGACFVAS